MVYTCIKRLLSKDALMVEASKIWGLGSEMGRFYSKFRVKGAKIKIIHLISNFLMSKLLPEGGGSLPQYFKGAKSCASVANNKCI